MQTEWKMCRHGRRVAEGDPPDAPEPEAAEASSEYLAKQIGQASFESEGKGKEESLKCVMRGGKIELETKGGGAVFLNLLTCPNALLS